MSRGVICMVFLEHGGVLASRSAVLSLSDLVGQASMTGNLCESIARVLRNMPKYKLMSGNSICWSAIFYLSRFCGPRCFVVTVLISVVLWKVCVGVVAPLYGRWSFCCGLACVC